MIKKSIFILCIAVYGTVFADIPPYIYNEGNIFGGYYNITYKSPDNKDFQNEIEKILNDINNSLSLYNASSIISRINQNDTTVTTDLYFEQTYKIAFDISEKTKGAFDITIAPLVNAWGFGVDNKNISNPNIDSIMQYVGYKKIKLHNHKIVKDNPNIILDVNAIVPGFACDVIGEFLEQQGICDYLVEIGGEIMCKGYNPKGEKWIIGVDKPIEDPHNSSFDEDIQTVISVSNCGVATSGNYRRFYYSDGKKISHIINPHTGYPQQQNIVSATIIAPSGATADAYATAAMVLGMGKGLKILKKIPDISYYLIYIDKNGEYKVLCSKGFKKHINIKETKFKC